MKQLVRNGLFFTVILMGNRINTFSVQQSDLLEKKWCGRINAESGWQPPITDLASARKPLFLTYERVEVIRRIPKKNPLQDFISKH